MEKPTIKDFTIIYGQRFVDMLAGIIERSMHDLDDAPFDDDQARLLAKAQIAKTHLEIIMAINRCNPSSREVKEIIEQYIESEDIDDDDEEEYELEDADELLKLFS